MKILLGVSTYNTKPFTEIFLETLKISIDNCIAAYAHSSEEFELKVVVIDNGSVDGVMELSSKYPWTKWIRNEENRGCAGAWNQAIKEGFDNNGTPLFDYYIIASNDVYFTKNWLENYIKCLQQNASGKYGWISTFLNDYKEPELTGVQETVNLENIYWSIRPNANDVKSSQQMLSILNMAYAPFGGIENFSNNLKNKHGFGLKEMHPKAVLFALSKACIEKVGLFDEWATPIGLHEDADYCERIRRYSDLKFAASYGAYIHHFSMMTRTRVELDELWKTAREENFQKKWTIHSKEIGKLPTTVGMRIEMSSNNMAPRPGWYHMDKNLKKNHIEFPHNVALPIKMHPDTVQEILCHNVDEIEKENMPAVLISWYNTLKNGGKITIDTSEQWSCQQLCEFLKLAGFSYVVCGGSSKSTVEGQKWK